jgi:hypothetical protein
MTRSLKLRLIGPVTAVVVALLAGAAAATARPTSTMTTAVLPKGAMIRHGRRPVRVLHRSSRESARHNGGHGPHDKAGYLPPRRVIAFTFDWTEA